MPTAAELLVKVGWDNTGVEKGAKDAEKEVQSLGSRMGDKAKAAGLIAGGAIGAALVAGLGESFSREAGADLLVAQLGDQAPDAERLGAIAGNLYGNAFGSSMEEVRDSIGRLFRGGIISEESTDADIERLSGKMLNLTSTFEQDAERMSGAVASMLKSGVAANADEAFDVLTRGFQNGTNKADDLLDTFTEYSTIFSALGLDSSEALGLMNQGLAAGARNSDVVADALKEFQIRATDGSAASSLAFQQLGLDAATMTNEIAKGGEHAQAGLDLVLKNLSQMEDPVARNAAAVGLFGTKAEDLAGSLFALDPTTAVSGLGEVAGSADQLGETLAGNTATKLESFKRQALGTLVSFIETKGIPVFERFVGFVRDNQGPFTALAAVLGTVLVAAVTGYVISLVSAAVATTVQTGIMIAKFGITVATTVAGWLSMGASAMAGAAVMAAAWLISIGPIALVIAAVVGLVVLVVKNWDTIKEATAAAWDWIVGAVKKGIDFIVWLFLNFTGPGLIIQHWDTIKSVISGAWDAIKGFVTGGIDSIVNTIRGAGSTIWNTATGMFDGIKNAFKSAINFIIRGWNSLQFSIPGFKIGPIGYSGFTLGVPQIPYLATGGDVLSSGLAFIHQGERVMPAAAVEPLPNGATGSGGDVYNLTVNMPPGSNGEDVVNALKRYQRRNGGRVPIAVTG